MSDILERVRRLVELSASPNENEARVAAVLACRLIREYQIVLSDRPVSIENEQLSDLIRDGLDLLFQKDKKR